VLPRLDEDDALCNTYPTSPKADGLLRIAFDGSGRRSVAERIVFVKARQQCARRSRRITKRAELFNPNKMDSNTGSKYAEFFNE
jgi:hypothetical protein